LAENRDQGFANWDDLSVSYPKMKKSYGCCLFSVSALSLAELVIKKKEEKVRKYEPFEGLRNGFL